MTRKEDDDEEEESPPPSSAMTPTPKDVSTTSPGLYLLSSSIEDDEVAVMVVGCIPYFVGWIER